MVAREQSLSSILQQELEDAYRPDNEASFELALAYYDGETGDVKPGWSDLVSTDVRDAIEGTVSEIMGAIGDEPLAWFAPLNQDEDDQAEKETWIVQHELFSRNRGRQIIESALRDALLCRYGVVKVWMDERTDTKTKTYENIPPESLSALSSVEEPSTAIIEEVVDNKDGTITAVVRYELMARDLKVQSIAPEDFRWSTDLTSNWLSDARFLAERVYYTRAQLKTLGVDDSVADRVQAQMSNTSVALKRRGNLSNNNTAARKQDQLIECWWCWLRNEDESRKRILFAQPGTILLEAEDFKFHPYAGGVVTTRPHRFDGVSLFDRMQQLQTAKTYMLRQLATQAHQASKMRLAVRDRGANPEDVVSDDLNPVIRTNGAPSDNILPLPIVDVTTQLLNTMQYLDKSRREQGGASIDMASPEMQVAQQSAHATEREFSYRELQSEQLLRTLGETLIRSMYLLAHCTLREYSPGVINARQDNKWIAEDPQKWPYRSRVVLELGATLGTKTRRLQALSQLKQEQMMIFSGGGGGIMVTLDNIYQAQIQWMRTAGILNPEKYYQDPASPQAQQSAQSQQQQQAQAQQAMQAQQQQAMQLQMTMLGIEDFKAKSKAENDRLSAQLDAMNNKMQIQEKYFADLITLITAKTEETDEVDQLIEGGEAAAGLSGSAETGESPLQ